MDSSDSIFPIITPNIPNNLHNVTVRRVCQEDVHELVNQSRSTFYETFGPHKTTNKAEDIDKYLQNDINESVMTKELSNPHSIFFFVHVNNEVAGYLKLNCLSAQTMDLPDSALEIERIYVLEKFQGRRLGAVLMSIAIDTAEAKNSEYVWLGVWEHNIPAIQFYKKYDFQLFDQKEFIIGEDVQTDHMFRRIIYKK